MGKVASTVYVLDLDCTIIGTVLGPSYQYHVAAKAEELGILEDGRAFIRPWIVDGIKAIIRPHFIDFYTHVKKQGAHAFIYTSSATEWANYVIDIIEEIIGLTFERPLFTRNNVSVIDQAIGPQAQAQPIIKSIANVLSDIEKSLGRKVAVEDIVIIDDDSTVWSNEEKKRYTFVHCPRYNYGSFVDPFEGFYPNVRKHPEIARMYPNYYNPGGDARERYQWCINTCAFYAREFEWLKNDEFWLRFRMCGPKGCNNEVAVNGHQPTRARVGRTPHHPAQSRS